MKLRRDDLPADLADEIERYQKTLEAKGQPSDLPSVLHRLLRYGLAQAKVYAFIPVKASTTPDPAPDPTLPPSSKPIKAITHQWAAGLVLPCGVWKSGNRYSKYVNQVTCIDCQSRRSSV